VLARWNVKANLQQLSSVGKLRGPPPFGWRFISKEADFEEIPEQQAIISLRKSGLSYTKITNKLNEDGDDLHKKKKVPGEGIYRKSCQNNLV
jgi:DNA invertase Pin-like site-specific DNA recombinase